MAYANSVGFTTVTTTGTVLGTPSIGNYVIHGYSLKGSGAVATLDVNDTGTYLFSIPILSAAGAQTNMFPVGVKAVGGGAITLSGVSTNLSQFTLFYNKE